MAAQAAQKSTMERASARCVCRCMHQDMTLCSNVWLREIFDKADVNHDEELTLVRCVRSQWRLICLQSEVSGMLASLNVNLSQKEMARKFHEVMF